MKSVIVKQSFTRDGRLILEPVPGGRHATKRDALTACHAMTHRHDLRILRQAAYDAHVWAESRRRQ
ncbi:MAG: hypothetical protein JO252_11110 [Planctomycetaceae bacterium]|nr:hypothetical protein [Planctomycetaceae bacterium]